MKNVIKKLILIILFIISVVATIMLYNKGLKAYFIVAFSLSIVFFVVLITSISLNKNSSEKYESEVKNIIKIYDAILVKSDNYPKINNRNIIKIDNIEDLIDAQLEIRKPIYYIKEEDSCCFIILDTTEALIFIMRKDENVKCQLDLDIEQFNQKREKSSSTKDNLLEDIENTTILKLSDNKKFKVSPLRNGEEPKENKELSELNARISKNIQEVDLIRTQIDQEELEQGEVEIEPVAIIQQENQQEPEIV